MALSFAEIECFNPRDQWHERAIEAANLVSETNLLTIEDVLVELLNFFSEYGEKSRRGAVAHVEGILSGANIEVMQQSHEGYSLTDCISMHAMREHGIVEILTDDDHFRQEGFTVLL